MCKLQSYIQTKSASPQPLGLNEQLYAIVLKIHFIQQHLKLPYLQSLQMNRIHYNAHNMWHFQNHSAQACWRTMKWYIKKYGYISMCLHNCTSPIHLPTMESLQETRNASGLLRIIIEWLFATDEVLCACFIDWQKAFDHEKGTIWMQILKGNGLDWHARRLISKLYMDQC